MDKDREFTERLLGIFRAEAEEHLRAMATGLVELEKADSSERQDALIETVFREAHSLKGAARAVNLTETEELCHALESVFSATKRRWLTVSPDLLDLLHQAVDTLGSSIGASVVSQKELKTPQATALARRLKEAASAAAASRSAAPEPSNASARDISTPPLVPASAEPSRAMDEVAPAGETVRIPVSRLTALLLETEELRAPKLASGERAAQLQKLASDLRGWLKRRSALGEDIRTLQRFAERPNRKDHDEGHVPAAAIARVLDFLGDSDGALTDLQAGLTAAARSAGQDHRELSAMVDGLLEHMKQTAMLPVSTLLETFPKLVRDLARDRGKNVDLAVTGDEIEADRRILEELKAPMIHLMRNAVDHGIEEPDQRIRNNKPPAARITISVSALDGGRFRIVIEDDGRGIDPARTRETAVKIGVLGQDHAEKLDEGQLVELIFRSGFSTASEVSELSGRGLGLAIVRDKIEKLGGHVTVRSRLGAGTAFSLELPLSLTSFRGVLVRAGDRIFVVPTGHVARVLRVAANEIGSVEDRPVLTLEGRPVAVVRLASMLGLPVNGSSEQTSRVCAVVLQAGEQRIACIVDEVLEEQEFLRKNLGRSAPEIPYLTGATVLATGKVVPILQIPDLIGSTVQMKTSPAVANETPEENPRRRPSVLVVEDSITARTLLKNILEAAGYRVVTAVDGLQAYSLLKSEHFDAVVSDVEMPRMDGFELTSKIRQDKTLAELPVLLVTGLDSSEQRERGLVAGANAYIVKSSFDQNNLLDIMRRLI